MPTNLATMGPPDRKLVIVNTRLHSVVVQGYLMLRWSMWWTENELLMLVEELKPGKMW